MPESSRLFFSVPILNSDEFDTQRCEEFFR